jgi:hypothetical protein
MSEGTFLSLLVAAIILLAGVMFCMWATGAPPSVGGEVSEVNCVWCVMCGK